MAKRKRGRRVRDLGGRKGLRRIVKKRKTTKRAHKRLPPRRKDGRFRKRR